MILDVTGIGLMPGDLGRDCLGNGKHLDKYGHFIECCCDECDYLQCCCTEAWQDTCRRCADNTCPRKENNTEE